MMATKIPHPISYTFREYFKRKLNNIIYYEGGPEIKRKKINPIFISIVKGIHSTGSSPNYWLKFTGDVLFGKHEIGLFKTKYKNIYYGNIDNGQHLIIFWFSDDKKRFVLDYYLNYFIKDLSDISSLIDK